INRSVELLQVHAAQLMRKLLLEDRIKIAPECTGSAHAVFPHAGLAFVNPERDRVTERSAVVTGIEPLVIKSMAAFMDAAEQTRLQLLFMHSRCDANVRGMERGREGMGREVNAASFKIVAHGSQNKPTEFELPCLIVSMEQDAVVYVGGAVRNFLQQVHGTSLHLGKQKTQLHDRIARLIDVQ